MTENETTATPDVGGDQLVQTDATAVKFVEPAATPPPIPTPEAEPVVEVELVEAGTSRTSPEPEQAAEADAKKDRAETVEKKKPEERDRYAELVDRMLKKERLGYLKRLGINTDLMSDEHILTLAPQVDVETPEGKTAIDSWRAQNERLFVQREATEFDIEALTANVKGSTHGTFGKDLMIKTLQRLAGK